MDGCAWQHPNPDRCSLVDMNGSMASACATSSTLVSAPSACPSKKKTAAARFFAECLRHSTKAKLYSAKSLPSAALGKEHTAKN